MQLSSEDLRQILGLLAQRKGFAKTKHCLISSPVGPLRNGRMYAHLVLGLQADRVRSLTHEAQQEGSPKPAYSEARKIQRVTEATEEFRHSHLTVPT